MEYLLAFIFLPLESVGSLYVVLFSVLILSGVGLPIPEEATLLLGGYLAYLGFTDFYLTLYVLVLGIVVADMFGYCLGRYGGGWISRKIARFKTTTIFLEKGKKYFERHGEKVVFFSRPLLGIRVAVPILAGHFKMHFGKFVLYDLAGAIPWTIFLVFASYYLGVGLDWIVKAREIKVVIFFVLGLAILSFAALRFLRNRKSASIV